MSIDYEEQYWTKFEEIVFNVTDTLKDANDVINEENCNDINNALSISIKKIQELLKLNEKEEYINFVDFNIASKILQLHDVLKDAVEEIEAELGIHNFPARVIGAAENLDEIVECRREPHGRRQHVARRFERRQNDP